MFIRSAARAAPRHIGVLIASLLVLYCIGPPAAAQQLTLAEAQRLAIARSRAIDAQDAAVVAARDMAVAAGQLPDPVATLGVNNLPINGPDAWSFTKDFMTMTNIGLMQEFTREEKREARAARYEREAEKALADKAAGIATIQRETAQAWLDRYYAEAMLAALAEQRRRAGAEVEAADSAYRAGRGNLADVLAARSSLVGLDDRGSELGRRAAAAKISLARWIGSMADTPLAGTPRIDTIRLDSRTLESEVEHQPQLATLEKQEAVAAAEVRAAEANKKADWSLSVMYSQRGPSYSNMISVNVSVPLQWDQKNRQDRELSAKLALLDQARAERQDMLRARIAELRAMIAEWESDRERSVRYERELLPLAIERTQATLAAYRGAKASLTDVLVARRNEADVRLQALQLQADTARIWAQLNFLVPADELARPATTHSKDVQ